MVIKGYYYYVLRKLVRYGVYIKIVGIVYVVIIVDLYQNGFGFNSCVGIVFCRSEYINK